MASRLDRLFILLETGSNPSTRKAAAQQLGQVQKLHPHELPHLLNRVHICYKSLQWETRIAAGQAIEAILSQVKLNPNAEFVVKKEEIEGEDIIKTDPTHVKNEVDNELVGIEVKTENMDMENPTSSTAIVAKNDGEVDPDIRPTLRFDKFNLNDILASPLLMSSESKFESGKEQDTAKQRSNVNKSLGLDIAEKIGIDTSSIFSNEDLVNVTEEPEEPLSLREANLAKRRARKLKSRELTIDAELEVKKSKTQDVISANSENPIDSFIKILIEDLFNPEWEVRHGAGTCLREIIKLREKDEGEENQLWLENITLQLVSVLALDRFGDFLTDTVVAPVRETVSQCLGSIIVLLNNENVIKLLQVLLSLLNEGPWEIRHGGLLAIKYLFAVRKDLTETLLPVAYPKLHSTLSDPVDDIVAASAAALIPISKELISLLPTESEAIITILWDNLNTLDDLSSSCNNIMSLLANLMGFSPNVGLRNLDQLLPRLWPFLHHTSSSVRRSSLLSLQKLTENKNSIGVLPLQITLKHVFQRALTENIPEILDLIPPVWDGLLKSNRLEILTAAACPLVGTWIYLSMQSPRLPFDMQFMVEVVTAKGTEPSMVEQKLYMSGSSEGDSKRLAKTRFVLARMIGMLAHFVVQPLDGSMNPETPMECFIRILLHHLNTRSSIQRTFIGMIISEWETGKGEMNNTSNDSISITQLYNRLGQILIESVYYDEIAMGFSKLQSECKDFLSTLKHYNVPVEYNPGIGLLNFEQIGAVCNESMIEKIQIVKKSKLIETLCERRRILYDLWNHVTQEFKSMNVMTLASISSAVISTKSIPLKLNPVVKPIMDSIKFEENELFQYSSAQYLARLISLTLTRETNPVGKIITNLVSFYCNDEIESQEGIISLEDVKKVEMTETVQRRGAMYALTNIVKYFGVKIKDVQKLWEITFGALSAETSDLKQILNALDVLEIISPYFHDDIFHEIRLNLTRTCNLLSHENNSIRHKASKCLSVWASLDPCKIMPIIIQEIIPKLEGDEISRRGGIEVLYCIIEKLGLNLLPYIVLLIVPVLGRMSDQDPPVRLLSSLTFASLVRLMPLEGSIPDPPDLPKSLQIQRSVQRSFLEHLLNPDKIPEYSVNVPINAKLRPYQQSGVNWLAFLNRYKLHGILCDDMGLGKTLQTICILAAANEASNGNNGSSPKPKADPSIVICPPTLTGHWIYEIEKFISKEFINPLHYHGPPVERNKLKGKLSQHNLVVASYDIVRNDIEFFESVRWAYCILDEGHVIKNGKTKISKAIKKLTAAHRLILSGTPIQNNVLELWSLFDFLMPGFLGSEKQFTMKFAKPILLARDVKSSPKDQEAGALAMESLHRQTLPFLLRRLKEDVLKDLPPKITQDYYCELSPIQVQLYDDFAKTRAHQNLKDTISTHSDDTFKHSHIFQALQYLRKVCNHPKLVLTSQHPKFHSIMGQLDSSKSALNDIQHSAKLPALKQLLLDCGIGVESNEIVNQHRALIFCQLKNMLDILENDLLKVHLPSVTYLRLDGSIPAGQRHSLVTKFNNDPSIDVLLLTTQVGGLGLNLTGADTVIFVEHDWNPMRDLQAMDRAHRIGQKKVVNVYRLITRGTLEEKIMGLQKFKLMTANTIISQENSHIETMGTEQLLDLFTFEDTDNRRNKSNPAEDAGIVGAYKNVLEAMPELWEDKLYEDEYDLSHFIKNLAK